MLSLFEHAISSLSLRTLPEGPMPFPISAFNILYLSPLNIKYAPGLGCKPFIFPMILLALSFQNIFPSALFIFSAYVALEWSCSLKFALPLIILSMFSIILKAAS